MSTSVSPSVSPRREMPDAPVANAKLKDWLSVLAPFDGMLRSTSEMSVYPDCTRSLLLRTCTGFGVSMLVRSISDPVITIVCSCCEPGPELAGPGVVCASRMGALLVVVFAGVAFAVVVPLVLVWVAVVFVLLGVG